MARVIIKSQRDPLIISNGRAKVLKQNHELFRDKKIEDTWVEIDSWAGYLSRIVEVHLEEERKYSSVPEEKPMTPSEVESSARGMYRASIGILGKERTEAKYGTEEEYLKKRLANT